MSRLEIAAEWFRFAQMDMDSAIYLQNMRPVPIEVICYHCQQAAEKYLKGALAAGGVEIPRTHNLSELNTLCSTMDASFSELHNPCAALTVYGVAAKYPEQIGICESDMKAAIAQAQKIQTFVSKYL